MNRCMSNNFNLQVFLLKIKKIIQNLLTRASGDRGTAHSTDG